jgi:hypothetical protein
MDQSNPKNYLDPEKLYFQKIEPYFWESSGSFSEKAHAFPRFVPRQSLSYFLARSQIFSNILNIHGNIMDFGIYRGSSFFTWLQLSSIMEPYNHIRKIIGFDSFQGFSEIGTNDVGRNDAELKMKRKGGMAYPGKSEIQNAIDLMDLNRPLGHVSKGRLVEGELPKSCENYLKENPETIVALANFGLGLYEPTLEILKLIKPRMVKGSIVVMEDLNQHTWPGETMAFFEVFGNCEHKLQRVPFCPHLSWIRIGD